MISGTSLLGREVAKDGRLLVIVSMHRVILSEGVHKRGETLYLMIDLSRDQQGSFSVTC
jgi:hypothetical protein